MRMNNGHMDMDDDACYRAIETRDRRFDGRLFVAVTTTGTYCRTFCPAPTPKRENVRFFPTAAAAQEAGFRPCLRCRPETSPDLAAWRGASNTVTRALRLIEGGALAAGFGSVRRFNETLQQLYERPPAALRRLGGGETPAGGGEVVRLMLPYAPPYDWDAMLTFLALRAIPGVERVERGRYGRTIGLGEDVGVLTVEPASKSRLAVAIRFPKISGLPTIIARVRRVFDLAADPVSISAHLSRDATLAPLVAKRPGLRVPGAWDGFELAIRAILGQQITVSAARGLAGKLTAAYGARLPADLASQGLTHVFPTPEGLAQADFAALGMPGARARALSAMTRAVAADPLIFGPKRS